MRRIVGLVSVLVLVPAMFMGVVAAQENSASSVGALPESIAAWNAAWETGDVEGILAAYTDDAILEDVALGTVAQGKEEIRAYIESQFAASPDLSVVPTSTFISGDWVAGEWTLTGTYTGQLPGLPPGDGQSVTIRGVGILELEGDKISVDREYWDTYDFLVAIGAVPAPEGAEKPEA